ncbi:GTP-binding protein [Leptolyngbya sp. NIES-2104]|uniref:GTP-binding protein n=1 Tax=Leptolyngbya sp. NIES-2104 TaxID=1552121 RepID=UPI0006EC7AF3|nr:GTP-binding protein [Leptolyngbya sp. NIES-2104]GAP98962.1 small GTP-binding protein domain [Leptolyngbya sp. NIES-2104]
MRLSRLITLVVGVAVILGLVIWLIDSITRLSWAIANPFLANLVIFLVIVLLGVLIAAFTYYFFWLPSRSRRRKRMPPPNVSEVKTEAAQENLQAVRQQVAQIQDEIARRELIARSKQIEQDLARREFRLVIFGTGSSGKTSLVNALIGQIVGKVGAPMGTTEAGATYRMKLQGVDREVIITDTPGILEAGVAGTERETLARRLATEADLIVFVLDNDLRQSEYEPLQALTQIGKRSIVVLNKADLYVQEDLEAILARLRERVRGTVALDDVVAIAANPPRMQTETGEWLYPDPEITDLIDRIVHILRTEGEDLLADNILIQSQRLGEEARRLIDEQRHKQAEKLVDRYQWIGAGVIAATPIPVVDLLATAAVNAQMVVEIGRIYGCEITIDHAREMAISLTKTLVGLGIVRGAIEIATTALQVSVAGLIAGRAIQGVSAAYLTRIAGRSFIEYFRNNQSWGDGGITEVVQKQFQLNRRDEFIKTFMQDAVTRVIRPLQLEMKAEYEPEPLEELRMPEYEELPRAKEDTIDDWK